MLNTGCQEILPGASNDSKPIASPVCPAREPEEAHDGWVSPAARFVPAGALGKTDQGRAGMAAAQPRNTPRFGSRQLPWIVTSAS